jgi:hypothetical protein
LEISKVDGTKISKQVISKLDETLLRKKNGKKQRKKGSM